MGPSYNCTAWDASLNVVGLLGWNDSSTTPLATPTGPIPPKTLRVSGPVFVDGDLGKEGGNNYSDFTYSGNGTIYFNGKFDLQKAKICGPGSGFVGTIVPARGTRPTVPSCWSRVIATPRSQ